MSQTSVSSDLLHSLQVLSELGVDTVGDELRPVAFADVSLSVEEPLGNVVVEGLGKDVVDLLNIFFFQLTSSLVQVNLSDLENEVGKSSANTLDGFKGEHGLAFTIDVCVLDSENVHELLSLDKVE